MSTTEVLGLAAAGTLVYVTAVWLLGVVFQNPSIIEIGEVDSRSVRRRRRLQPE